MGRATSCSSSSTASSTQLRKDLSTDLRLGLSISNFQHEDSNSLPRYEVKKKDYLYVFAYQVISIFFFLGDDEDLI